MSDRKDKDSPAHRQRGRSGTRRPSKADGSGRARAGDVGRALRTVYDSTLREEVPGDFLDLLGKLS